MTNPGSEDGADYYRERDKEYGTSELRIPTVVQPQTDDDTAAPAPMTFGELMESLDIVPGILQMAQETSRPGSGHMRLGSLKLQSNSRIAGLEPAGGPDSPPLLIAKPVEPVSFYRCI